MHIAIVLKFLHLYPQNFNFHLKLLNLRYSFPFSSRYQIVRNVDTFGTVVSGGDTRPTWYIICAIFSGLLMHVPYVLQYEILPCRGEKDYIILNCWRATPRFVLKYEKLGIPLRGLLRRFARALGA